MENVFGRGGGKFTKCELLPQLVVLFQREGKVPEIVSWSLYHPHRQM